MSRDSIWAIVEALGLRPLGLVGINDTWSAFRLRPATQERASAANAVRRHVLRHLVGFGPQLAVVVPARSSQSDHARSQPAGLGRADAPQRTRRDTVVACGHA